MNTELSEYFASILAVAVLGLLLVFSFTILSKESDNKQVRCYQDGGVFLPSADICLRKDVVIDIK